MMTMNIMSLISHIDKQIAHKDGREPNAAWISNQLKKYMREKDTESFIDDIFFSEEFEKISKCEWCMMPLKPKEKLFVVIDSLGRFRVCHDCLNQYANSEYDALTSKIAQVKG